MNYDEMDIFVSNAADDLVQQYRENTGIELGSDVQQEIADHLWFVFSPLVKEEK